MDTQHSKGEIEQNGDHVITDPVDEEVDLITGKIEEKASKQSRLFVLYLFIY